MTEKLLSNRNTGNAAHDSGHFDNDIAAEEKEWEAVGKTFPLELTSPAVVVYPYVPGRSKLVVPNNARDRTDEKPRCGVLRAVAPGVEKLLVPGQEVYFNPGAGQSFQHNGRIYLLMNVNDVIGKIDMSSWNFKKAVPDTEDNRRSNGHGFHR